MERDDDNSEASLREYKRCDFMQSDDILRSVGTFDMVTLLREATTKRMLEQRTTAAMYVCMYVYSYREE